MNKSFLAFVFFTPFIASADDETETIAVIGSRADVAVQLPAITQIINEQDIQRSGAQTVAELLATQIGLQLSDSIGNGARGVSVSMRGFAENASNNVLILVDGRKLNNPSLAGADLSTIALHNIARIEILQGSAGSLYGDQANSGVINIITKSAADNETKLVVSAGSYSTEKVQASVARQLNDKWSVRLDATQSDSDNYRDNNENKNQNIDARLQWRVGDAGVALSLQRVHDELGFPGALSEQDYRYDRRRSSTPNDYGDNTTEIARLNGDWSVNEQWAFFWDLTQREQAGSGEIFGSNFTTETEVKTLQPRAVAQLDNANGVATLVFGIDHEESGYRSDYGFGVSDFAQRNSDLYAQAIWPVQKLLSVTLAARLSQFDFAPSSGLQDYQDHINVYQLGVSRLMVNWRWFARFDQGFRWPNADENGFVTPGVEHLLAQRSKTMESGFEWASVLHKVAFNLFHIAIENEIVYDPAAPGPWGAGANINRDFAKRSGFTVSERWQINDAIQWSLAYSYIDANFDGGVFDRNSVPFVAKHSAKSQLVVAISDNWNAYAEADYTGSRYRAGDVANQEDQLGGYTLYNANLRWQNQQWFAQLRLNNLLDKSYSTYSGVGFSGNYYYAAAERNGQISVGYQF